MLPDAYEVTVQSFGKDTDIGEGTYSVLPSKSITAGQSNLRLDLRPVTVSGAVLHRSVHVFGFDAAGHLRSHRAELRQGHRHWRGDLLGAAVQIDHRRP